MKGLYRLLFCFGVLWCGLCHGANLHVIIVGDTECNIGRGIVRDIELAEREAERVARLTGLEPHQIVFAGTCYRPELVMNHLNHLQVQPEDVILFFHFSHGFRLNFMQSDWPALCFGNYQQSLFFEDIILKIYDKHPRFALVLADVCNVNIQYAGQLDDSWKVWDWLFPATRKNNFEQLFLHQHGVLAICSSRPGQASWISLEMGSLFTFSFFESLAERTGSAGATWEAIMQKTSAKTEWVSTHARNAGLQTPVWQWFSYEE